MDWYPIRLSRSCRISTIRWLAGLHVSRRIGQVLITASTSVRQSANAVCWLSDWPSVHYWSQQNNDPHLALMYIEVVLPQWTLHRNTQMRVLLSATWMRWPANGWHFIRWPDITHSGNGFVSSNSSPNSLTEFTTFVHFITLKSNTVVRNGATSYK